jgi:UDP-N-acetylglucosamine diphosphorylase / glucose-1-phosphate thymidylyltransferase / UDP-N-acetylgalactosamine diphosphorylase / glucosamine-1-phosphate N-acetyltransferase / galactosamine-1-phosphate N-acetyltransferase
MISISEYNEQFPKFFPALSGKTPWDIIAEIEVIIKKQIETLGDDFTISNGIAVHKSAVVEAHAVMKPPVIISEKCFVAAHAYMRGGVFVGPRSVVGPGCELKSCIILNDSALAHFNFAGDSIIGSHVNMEAGSLIANHYNERQDKTIHVVINGQRLKIPSTKFGALIGDHSRMGANSVLSPGTVLQKSTVVKRLQLIEQ